MRYAIVVLLLMGCGPSPETAACCECLVEHRCLAESLHYPNHSSERLVDYCTRYIEDDDGILAGAYCWEREDTDCATACEPHAEDLARGFYN